jgi:hypothetical protein
LHSALVAEIAVENGKNSRRDSASAVPPEPALGAAEGAKPGARHGLARFQEVHLQVYTASVYSAAISGGLMNMNRGRIWLGGVAGWVVWFVWSFLVGQFIIGNARYQAAQNAGLFLKQSRYPLFAVQWIAILFVLSVILAHLYA